MKKCFLLIWIAAVLLLCGCQAKEQEGMYLEPAQLNDQESAIAKLLGANTDQLILDFSLDETVRSVHLNTYELIDGEWSPINGGGGMLMEDAKGRMALGFDVIPDGMRIAIQSENHSHSSSHKSSEQMDVEGMGRSTSRMASRLNVEYEKECAVACQIITSKNEIHSYDTDYFEDPSRFAEHGYEHVYAVTIMFSQKPLQ